MMHSTGLLDFVLDGAEHRQVWYTVTTKSDWRQGPRFLEGKKYPGRGQRFTHVTAVWMSGCYYQAGFYQYWNEEKNRQPLESNLFLWEVLL
jgi:hypothetical protein